MYSRYIIPTLAATLIASVQSLTVDSVIHFGTGCPQDSTTFSVTEDGDSIVATFSPLAVRIGPSIDQSENTDFCGIGLNLASPSGQQFAPVSTTYYDNLNIPAGVTGSHIITYTFSGTTAVAETRHDYIGPVSGTFEGTDVVDEADYVWSECGEAPPTLLITNRGSVTESGDVTSGYSYFDTGSVTTEFVWRSC